jgi:hypothetical protein
MPYQDVSRHREEPCALGQHDRRPLAGARQAICFSTTAAAEGLEHVRRDLVPVDLAAERSSRAQISSTTAI